MTTLHFIVLLIVALLLGGLLIAILIIQLFTIFINQLNHHQMAKSQSEHAQELRDLKAQNDKARAEIVKKISDLETALANAGNTTPEVDEALAELKASVQIDDDLNPDEPTEPGL